MWLSSVGHRYGSHNNSAYCHCGKTHRTWTLPSPPFLTHSSGVCGHCCALAVATQLQNPFICWKSVPPWATKFSHTWEPTSCFLSPGPGPLRYPGSALAQSWSQDPETGTKSRPHNSCQYQMLMPSPASHVLGWLPASGVFFYDCLLMTMKWSH